MADEILILGATGRTGRGIARALDAAGVPLALFGRDPERLAAAAAGLTRTPRLVPGSLGQLARLLAEVKPAVVMSTVGPFATTAARVIDAVPAGTHYLDLSNEYTSFADVFARHQQALTKGQTLVPGAGFGVVSTESALLSLCAGQPRPSHVRVDALPSVALESGVVGAALAGSIVDSLPFGRRQVRNGRLISRAFDDTPAALTTPDGEQISSVNFTSGDLLTAWRTSEALNVVAGSSEIPAGAAIRYGLPVASMISRAAPVRRLMAAQLAQVKLEAKPKPRPYSWGHAAVTWPDGSRREAWLRVEDAMDFTCVVAAEVARRLARGEGRPGAFTPCALFGPELATGLGGELIL